MDEYQHDDAYHEKIEKMVAMTIAGAKGLVPLGQVLLPLAQIAKGHLAPSEARDLAQTLVRILKGERDPIDLATDLSPEMAEVVWEALAQIEAPLPELGPENRQELTFAELIEQVAAACTGELLLWQSLWRFTGELATDERVSPSIRTLGLVLRKILAGERQSYILADLSAEHRWAVEQLLTWLNEQAIDPG